MAITDARFTQTQRLNAEKELDALQSSLDWLRNWSVASTLLIAVLVGWLGHFLWRELVAPLRAQVIEAEILIRRQAKLSTLGRFAAGVAHEIRNPLNSIKARLYAQDRLLPAESAAREDNRVISDEVVRLEHIVQDFLAFSRPPEPQLELISASGPLRTAGEVLRPELERDGIRLQLAVREDPPIRADAAQLQQVLVNLIRNARESMTGGGRLTLRCGTRVARREEDGTARAVIEVRDTGAGIPPEVQVRLFEPFFTTKSAGSGLGLSISAQIVEAHGGQIECETQLNVGTAFRMLLPVATDHAEPAEPSSDS
jgi:signal transduction histidine kinase